MNNVEKKISKGVKAAAAHPEMGLREADLKEVIKGIAGREDFRQAVLEALCKSYYMGVAAGSKAN